MRFSPSRLKNWMTCQLQSYYKYELHLPDPTGSAAVYGSAIHLATEQYNLHNLSEDEAIEVFKDYLENNEPDYYNRNQTKERYLREGEFIIRTYIQHDLYRDLIPVAFEYKFKVKVGDHELNGIIDAIFLSKDHKILYIVDYKTGKKPNADSLNMNIQFTAYELASLLEDFWVGDGNWSPGFEDGSEIWKYLQDAERKTIWHDMKDNRQFYISQKDIVDFGRLYRLMDSISTAYEKEVFIPTIDESSCTWCPYTNQCPVYVPQFRDIPTKYKEEDEWKN